MCPSGKSGRGYFVIKNKETGAQPCSDIVRARMIGPEILLLPTCCSRFSAQYFASYDIKVAGLFTLSINRVYKNYYIEDFPPEANLDPNDMFDIEPPITNEKPIVDGQHIKIKIPTAAKKNAKNINITTFPTLKGRP